MVEHPLWERQRELEESMRARGVDRFMRAIERERARGQETSVGAAKSVVNNVMIPFAKAIQAATAEAMSGAPGRSPKALLALWPIDPALVACVALKVIVDGLSGGRSLTSLACEIAAVLQTELRVRKLAKTDDLYVKAIQKDLKKKTANDRHRTRIWARHTKAVKAVEVEWTRAEQLAIGVKLVEILSELTGAIQIDSHYGEVSRITATQAFLVQLGAANDRLALLRPARLPTLIPPKPWEGVFGGGYWTNNLPPMALVKLHGGFDRKRRKAHLEELNNARMPAVYEAVNAIQETGWRVNEMVLRTARHFWDHGIARAEMPLADREEMPPKPLDIDTNDEAKSAWKLAAREVYAANAELMGRKVQTLRLLELAQEFAPEAAIYFPHQLDWRGRIYAVPGTLNPQGGDLSKGLLKFASGKPLGTPEAARWLAIHIANCAGVDKVSFDDRVAWVEQHDTEILLTALDPLYDLWWTDLDSPWQFLAACEEWAGYREHGLAHVSHIPVSVDGTCNGLQHFSALLRDERGGAAVNLVPADKPQDIYRAVAERTQERLEAWTKITTHHAPGGKEDEMAFVKAEWARKWLAWGIDRKMTKRPVMVVPYGGTIRAATEYVSEEYVKSKVKKGDPFTKEERGKAVGFITNEIWAAIGETVVSARSCMSWLQKCARLLSKAELPVTWRAPTGFLVQQVYLEEKERRIELMVFGRRFQPVVVEYVEKFDPARAANGVAPNFVHSLDAAALVETVVRCLRSGVTSYAMIHDSYGTHAADVPTLNRELRAAFFDLYDAPKGPLECFREGVSGALGPDALIPAVLGRGSLDLSVVHKSLYFFA